MAMNTVLVALLLGIHCALAYPTTLGPPTTYPTTRGPPTTTPECTDNSGSVKNCMSYFCYEGKLQPFEFTATQSCCDKMHQGGGGMHPRCIMMYPERYGTTPPSLIGK
ncbi:uncharacterized protein LOC124132097 [Haliotis rufescens]|uniref:uncharacterized protein LOC124132097 n=1 Tax=Haliotis rufescens TaxID=6454 RepID=UPI00201E81C3|nr:uncharacterized protein LOC124132097 [Haliotis rufescens]